MQIDADARLAAAAGGAARYLGDAAGLESDAIVQLQTAIVSACVQAFDRLTQAHPHLDVTFTRLVDRIEIALSYEGEAAPAIGLDALAGLTAQVPKGSGRTVARPGVLEGVDRVQYENKAGVTVTRLTKYLAQDTRRF